MSDNNRRLVYSTDDGDITPKAKKDNKPGKPAAKTPAKKAEPTLSATNKTVYVERDRKGRGGKTVTVVSNLQLPQSQLEEILKKLKTHVGAGGALKEGNLEIQGDHRDKVIAYLQKEGHQVKQKGG